MTIRGFGSETSTTVDVNDGQSSQVFSQVGDAEYDVSVSATVNAVSDSGSASGGTAVTDTEGVDHTILKMPGTSLNISISWSISANDTSSSVDIYVDGNLEDEVYTDGASSSGSTTSTNGDVYVHLQGDTDYTVNWSFSETPAASVNVDSISQA